MVPGGWGYSADEEWRCWCPARTVGSNRTNNLRCIMFASLGAAVRVLAARTNETRRTHFTASAGVFRVQSCTVVSFLTAVLGFKRRARALERSPGFTICTSSAKERGKHQNKDHPGHSFRVAPISVALEQVLSSRKLKLAVTSTTLVGRQTHLIIVYRLPRCRGGLGTISG